MKLIKFIIIFCFGISITGIAQDYNLSDKLSNPKRCLCFHDILTSP